MKKFILLITIFVYAGYGFAQQTLIFDSFEEYTVGNPLASESNASGHTWWTTWYNHPGSNEDALVSNNIASDGTKSVVITGFNDNILLLGDLTEGDFDLTFDIYIPAGNYGYFNLITGWEMEDYGWPIQVYINAQQDSNGYMHYCQGHGTAVTPAAGIDNWVYKDFPCVEDEWMSFRINFYCYWSEWSEAYLFSASVYLNDNYIQSCWGNVSPKFDICAASSTSEFYLDNVKFVRTDNTAVDSESSLPWVNLYPNPAHSEITLEGDNLSRVSVYNALGQLVRVETLHDGSNTLSLDLEQGVYFFRVFDSIGNTAVQRVAVVR